MIVMQPGAVRQQYPSYGRQDGTGYWLGATVAVFPKNIPQALLQGADETHRVLTKPLTREVLNFR